MTGSLAARRPLGGSARVRAPLSLVVPLVVGLVAFLWRLGASSLFVDETASWHVAAGSLAGVFRVDRATEVAPPLYYLLLHLWIGAFGSDSEWAMRSLSVLAGVGLVAAVWWLGRLSAGEEAALLAALGAALSPLVVQYAQEARSYVFVMLCATLAVAAAIEATSSPAHAGRWIALSAAASVATIWLHYTGLFVIAPLVLYVWSARSLSPAAKRGYLTSSAAAFVIVAPLMVIQVRAGHQGGVAPTAHPTLVNFLRILGTPFDGRFTPHVLTYVTGAAAVALALALTVRTRDTRRSRERRLILAAAVIPLLAVTGVTVAAKLFDEHTYYSLITRYTTVAAPFLLVVLAWAILEAARPAALATAALVVVAGVSGLLHTYSRQSFPPDLHGAIDHVERGWRAGDTVVLTGAAAQSWDPAYYVARLRHARPGAAVVRTPGTTVAVPGSGPRVWVVFDTGSAPQVSAALSQAGRHALSTAVFDPDVEVELASR